MKRESGWFLALVYGSALAICLMVGMMSGNWACDKGWYGYGHPTCWGLRHLGLR